MRVAGFTMIVFGLLGSFFFAVGVDTGVSTGVSGRVENIGLLSRQSNGLIVSGLLFMTGCILVGLAAVRDAVDRLGPAIIANAPRAMPPAQQRSAPLEPAPSPNDTQSAAQSVQAVAEPSFSKICPDCGSISMGTAKTCRRCGHQYSDAAADASQVAP
ncbi:putative RNA-binding Zn-ribbon protein involved in translation (DUF1610 family) [Azospirillum lipoferum]|uniref:Uncharacterized protein n=1 Tax=Azospirillum lipoferum TaxID=193 RepID=A0A5A9GGY8_AZOLI|nr:MULTISPECIES: hypothetical protein [Azospirillum]KAA0592964.1 hypothetical protein FZ942_25920 [Azospirillum lipoferum]MCP1613979.1 putative RNA-binding Zn-ribbon protein involved in translation (DUF1610 family) [Azospirillum lipoferum]MDW5537629.1 hypothetical protein [Azospirillum sp. NL1]